MRCSAARDEVPYGVGVGTDSEVVLDVVCRCDWPLLLATLDTHGPMPWVPADEADALQLLTAWVTTSPWLVVDELDEVSELVLSEVSSELVELELEESLTVSVWCWWLDVGLEVRATAPPAPAVTATTAIPAAALEVTRLMSLARSKV
jgi:hypothetical protein